MAKKRRTTEAELTKEVDIEDLLADVFMTFGTAMRHTMINHKTKSQNAWRELAGKVMTFAEEIERR